MVRKEKGKSTYEVVSHTGKSLGSGYSLLEAQKRLAQIEMFKAIKKQKNKK